MTVRLTTETFIRSAKEVHGEKYDYSLIEYKDSRSKVEIVCRTHGSFFQLPSQHTSVKNGCIKCYHTPRIDTTEIIKRFRNIHGDRYNYSKSIYNGFDNNIIISCDIHGDFQQTPSRHLIGANCPKCRGIISKLETAWLDSLMISTECRQKNIYIDGKRLKVDAYVPETNTVYEFWGDFWHGNPKRYKQDQMNIVTKCTFGELFNKTQERIRLIISAQYNLIEKWETE